MATYHTTTNRHDALGFVSLGEAIGAARLLNLTTTDGMDFTWVALQKVVDTLEGARLETYYAVACTRDAWHTQAYVTTPRKADS